MMEGCDKPKPGAKALVELGDHFDNQALKLDSFSQRR